jgi:cyclopropane-fatty-acyl-phospholipid synthase
VDQTFTLEPAEPAPRAARLAPPAAGRLFLRMLEQLRVGHLGLALPDGQRREFGSAGGSLSAQLLLIDWRACALILRAGDIGFGEALRRGWVASPDLTALLRLAIGNEPAIESAVWGGRVLGLWYRLLHALRRNTRAGSRDNIHAHYDLGNAFYGLWLDATWTYSSALFRGDFSASLEAAQRAKYQRVIDTLDLRPGMRVLEIGCGWGGFALYAGERGIRVHGVTISPAQLELARGRVEAAGLGQRVQLELRDYRDLHERYDAIVSIEMFEAVGISFWDTWFDAVHALLLPRGRALVQSITIDEARFARYRASSDFIRHFIFPGGMLPSVKRFVAAAAAAGMVTKDIFAFGKDYAETMRRWRARFEHAREAILGQGFDEAFVRTWHLYLCYCEAGFDEGRTDVVQFLLQRREV